MTEIKTIAELKKAIKDEINKLESLKDGAYLDDRFAAGVHGLRLSLEKIEQFERTVNERIEELENTQDGRVCYNKNAWLQKELRKLLGEKVKGD